MKTTLLLSLLALGCLTVTAQNAPPSTKPAHIDPIRFSKYDLNRDGKLDLQEQAAEKASRPAWEAERRAQATASKQKLAEQKQKFDLEKFDANKDGALDASEQKARDQWYAERRKEFIAKYDKNGDGKVSAEEIKPPAAK